MNRHVGPAYTVSWAHPKFGSLFASCGFDSTVKVWHETSTNKWELAYEENLRAPVQVAVWAPFEYGLMLLCGTRDGKIHLLRKEH